MSASAAELRTDVPLALLYGDAEVLKERAVQALVEDRLDESEREYGLIRLDANETAVEGIVAELNSGSLMAPRRVIVVRDITALHNLQQRALARHLGQIPPGLALVLVAAKQEGGHSWGPPVAAELRRAVEGQGQVLELRPPASLPGWAASEAQRFGKRLDPDAAAVLCDTVGSDLDRLLREIEKLTSYVGEREEITAQDVREVSVRVTEEDIFELMDAIGHKDAGTALTLLDGVLPEGSDRGEYIPFVGMIARQIRLIWQARFLRQCGVPLSEIQSLPDDLKRLLPEHHNFPDATAGRKSWLAEKFTRQAAMFSDGQLARALDAVHQADLMLKGRGRMAERAVIELLIARLCR